MIEKGLKTLKKRRYDLLETLEIMRFKVLSENRESNLKERKKAKKILEKIYDLDSEIYIDEKVVKFINRCDVTEKKPQESKFNSFGEFLQAVALAEKGTIDERLRMRTKGVCRGV